MHIRDKKGASVQKKNVIEVPKCSSLFQILHTWIKVTSFQWSVSKSKKPWMNIPNQFGNFIQANLQRCPLSLSSSWSRLTFKLSYFGIRPKIKVQAVPSSLYLAPLLVGPVVRSRYMCTTVFLNLITGVSFQPPSFLPEIGLLVFELPTHKEPKNRERFFLILCSAHA